MGTLHVPVPNEVPPALEQIAECCNKATDCNDANKGKGCRVRGIHKHKCCEVAIKKKNWPNVKAEAPFPAKGSLSALRLDVLVNYKGNTYIYDFKFNCSRDPYMSEKQKNKYRKYFKKVEGISVKVKEIASKKTKGVPDNKVGSKGERCKNAKKAENC
jgi:hypothetical protein